jgi:hypothetical protein
MDPYLQIQVVGGWTSIYYSDFDVHQGFSVLTHPHIVVIVVIIKILLYTDIYIYNYILILFFITIVYGRQGYVLLSWSITSMMLLS